MWCHKVWLDRAKGGVIENICGLFEIPATCSVCFGFTPRKWLSRGVGFNVEQHSDLLGIDGAGHLYSQLIRFECWSVRQDMRRVCPSSEYPHWSKWGMSFLFGFGFSFVRRNNLFPCSFCLQYQQVPLSIGGWVGVGPPSCLIWRTIWSFWVLSLFCSKAFSKYSARCCMWSTTLSII